MTRARRTGPRRARRYFAVVNDGQVLTSCESTRHYRFVVLHTGLNGTFATFHWTLGGALRAKTRFPVESAPTKQIVAPLVTTTLLRPGTRLGALMTTWDERMTARTPQAPRLEAVEVLWRMTGPRGRLLDCGIYRTDVGLEVRCGYGEHELLRSQYAVEIGTARAIAEQWRQAVLAKGGFSAVGGDTDEEA